MIIKWEISIQLLKEINPQQHNTCILIGKRVQLSSVNPSIYVIDPHSNLPEYPLAMIVGHATFVCYIKIMT